jgi:hypothetical protein
MTSIIQTTIKTPAAIPKIAPHAPTKELKNIRGTENSELIIFIRTPPKN